MITVPVNLELKIDLDPNVIAGLVKAQLRESSACGEKYAGITIHDGKPARLYLLPGEKESITWNHAMDWATEQGAHLPSRIDQLVLLKNLKSEFKEACYWSGEQHALDSAYAWYQGFYDGIQLSWHKDNKRRARLVRRVPIQ